MALPPAAPPPAETLEHLCVLLALAVRRLEELGEDEPALAVAYAAELLSLDVAA